jgi:hypothetical protein
LTDLGKLLLAKHLLNYQKCINYFTQLIKDSPFTTLSPQNKDQYIVLSKKYNIHELFKKDIEKNVLGGKLRQNNIIIPPEMEHSIDNFDKIYFPVNFSIDNYNLSLDDSGYDFIKMNKVPFLNYFIPTRHNNDLRNEVENSDN